MSSGLTRNRWSVEGQLNQLSPYLLLASFGISIAITLPRFAAGIPMSVDTTSHLYRVLFFTDWLKQGVPFPSWSPDWYAGAPSILLYPPLGYYIVVGLASLGLDPVLSYKLVDAAFYWVGPLTVYVVCREFSFGKGESALAAAFFSVVPEVIENYLFFDRFPTVLSIPIFCVFLIMFHRSLTRPKQPLNLVGSVFALSALTLTHHLSAFIAGIVAVLMVLVAMGKFGFKTSVTTLAAVGIGTLGLAAFWFVPFVTSLSLFPRNPFYNRNVYFEFIRFPYFSFDIASYLLGIAQLVLAAIAVQSILGRTFGKRLPFKAMFFFPILLAGMMFFYIAELFGVTPMENPGTYLVIVSFAVFLGQFLFVRRLRNSFKTKDGVLVVLLWFTVFFWVGLGYYALPLVWLPYLKGIWARTMDVYRIWLYLAIPMAALAARGFWRCMAKLWRFRPIMPLVLVALTLTPIVAGVAVKTTYPFTHKVNDVYPYSTSNAEIPQEVIDYFKNDPSQGRILGINVTFWIFVLPVYVGKPIIDGWYPQTKLVNELVDISDYRIDDLETTPTQAKRIGIWRMLVADFDKLDITWVIVGGEKLATQVMSGLDFEQVKIVPYSPMDLVIYKAKRVPSYAQVLGSNDNPPIVERPNPDRIVLKFEPPSAAGTLLVKEAYFPTWAATADGKEITVHKEGSTGYMWLEIPRNTIQVTIYQMGTGATWDLISAVTFALLIGVAIFEVRKRRLQGIRAHVKK